VVVFSIRKVSHGAYGTRLTASPPQALASFEVAEEVSLSAKVGKACAVSQ